MTELKLYQLPFYWAPMKEMTQGDLPLKLPFVLAFEKETGRFYQRPLPEVQAALDTAYSKGTELYGLMDDSGVGLKYTEDFLDFIGDVKGKKVLEIGCGKGYLLYRMKEMGADVIGYEPGFKTIGKFDVPVYSKCYPSEDIEGQTFDLIVAYCLLEHMEDPSEVLHGLKANCRPGTRIILAVPDCEEHIRNGDISMLIHEHYSYFTKDSFSKYLDRTGFAVARIQDAGIGSSIYVDVNIGRNEESDPPDYSGFFDRFERQKRRFSDYLASIDQLGVYVPTRAMNLLSIFPKRLKGLPVRFFDDSEAVHNTYIPGFDQEIENFDDLVRNPTDNIVIFSYPFGDKIKKRLKGAGIGSITVSELFS